MFYFYQAAKTIYFTSPTLISYIDLTTMGGSDKEGDETKIGTYCSGLKYAMALALRNNVEIIITVNDSEPDEIEGERKRETVYRLGKYMDACEQTGKEKELIQLTKSLTKESFHSGHREDLGGGDWPDETIPTAFSTRMGIDWELWMLLREIYSNMIDEGGEYHEDDEPKMDYGTTIQLIFPIGSEFDEIWTNRHLYINVNEPLYKISQDVEVLRNQEGFLRIYKQNILVYSNKDIPSKYAYNVKFGVIDEKRVLSNMSSVRERIQSAIAYTTNTAFLSTIITKDKVLDDEDFLAGLSYYGKATNLITSIAHEVFDLYGEVNSYPWIIKSIKLRPDCRLKGKIIQSIQESLYDFSEAITLESEPVTISEVKEDSISEFQKRVNQYYNFNVDVEVKVAELSNGNKVVADRHENCIIVSEDFDITKDFPIFVVHYIELTRKGNIIKNLGYFISELLTKK